MTSLELEKLLERYKRIKFMIVYFFIAGIIGFIVDQVLIWHFQLPEGFTGLNYPFVIGSLLFIAYLVVLLVLYALIRNTLRSRLMKNLEPYVIDWRMQAIKDTIDNIQSEAPVPIEKIDSFVDTIYRNKISSLKLLGLRFYHPETEKLLQDLLYNESYLGTYYPVEQQFVKNIVNKLKE